MVKQQLSIRLEKPKLERLKNIAINKNKHYSELIRDKVDEILNGHDEDTQNKVRTIVKELREPFIFFTTKQGRAWASEEKARREKIAQVIERCFNL